jgi:predicted Zn-dependent protease
MPNLNAIARLKLAALAASAALALLGGCATNPVTGGSDIVTMSEAQEIELGRKSHPQVLQQYGRFEDEPLQQYVNDVGQRIAAKSHRPNLQYTFTVLDSDDVNAFALPGGFVYITRGIMSYLNSEAELAAVLGHEIGHVTARHSVRQQTGATAAGVGAMVVGILTGSGDLYEPDAMIDVVRLLKNQEIFEVQMARQENRKPRVYHGLFASHPDNDTRLQEVVKAAGKLQNAEDRPPNRDLYLARLNGLPVGDSRAQGVVRGSRFYHADLGVTLAFPSGWLVDNQRAQVLAFSAAKDMFMKVSAQAPPPGMAPKEFLARLLQGTPTTGGQAIGSNGLDGYQAVIRSTSLPWGTQGPAAIAVVFHNNLAYIFQGATRQAAGMSSFEPVFTSTVKTFRRLRDNEFTAAEPDRIRVVQAGPNTKIQQLAQKSPLKTYPAERLRLLNDLYPDKEPTPGQKLKIVD